MSLYVINSLYLNTSFLSLSISRVIWILSTRPWVVGVEPPDIPLVAAEVNANDRMLNEVNVVHVVLS